MKASTNRIEIDQLLKRGELARAARLLRRELKNESRGHRTVEIESELTLILVRQSRYQEAYEMALELESKTHLPTFSFVTSLILSVFISIGLRFGPARLHSFLINLVCRFLRFNPGPGIEVPLESILWGTYWQNMRHALSLNLLSVLAASTGEKRMRALAFLNYTLAYMGYGILGLPGLRRIIHDFEKNGLNRAAGDLLVWLAVVEQMNSEVERCFATHARLEAAFPDTHAFHQIISLASQLNTSVAELGPRETASAIDRCFAGSFALKASRNHIQIFGAKAALLAVEGRMDEARSFLSRSYEATKRNANSLDYLIYHRLAAVVHVNGGDFNQALENVKQSRQYLSKFAWVMWYVAELNRLEMIARYQKNPRALNCFLQTLRYVGAAIFIPNLRLWRNALQIAIRNLRQGSCAYWSDREVSLYRKERLSSVANSNTNSNLEKITLRLAHVILGDTGKIRTPNSSSLKSDVSQVLEITDFVESDSLEHCLRTVRENYGIKSNFILNEEGNSLRAVVNNGQSFIGVSIPHENEFLSFGVLVAKTDLIENEAVEVVLKVLGALHLSRLTEAAAREERALNQQRLALANLASQVAHDIRSPLSALSMLTSLAVELPEDKRNLMRNATQRINDIANSLLNRGRVGELKSSIVSEPPRRISILNLVDSILSEKRLQVTGKSRIEIVAPVYYPYGLFVFVPVIEMKRALSNLLNNAIEAIASEGLIKLEVTSEGSSVQIKIRDNGVGMPAEILEKLGRQSVSHGKGGDQSGFGLGLPHAYETVRCAGGEIEVFSRLAEGTQVNVKLPKVDPPSWHLPHLDLKAKRVFAVVDDDVSIQDSWRRRLRSLNCPVKFMGFSSIDELAIWFHGQGESARESLIISMDYEFIGSVETGLDGIRRIGLQDVAFLVTSRCEEEEISREATNLRIPVVSKRDINLIPISF